MKRLIIVADHSLVVQAIRLALRQTAGFQVIGFVDGRQSVAAGAGRDKPDVVLVDDMQVPEHALARLGEVAATVPDGQPILLTLRLEERVAGRGLRRRRPHRALQGGAPCRAGHAAARDRASAGSCSARARARPAGRCRPAR